MLPGVYFQVCFLVEFSLARRTHKDLIRRGYGTRWPLITILLSLSLPLSIFLRFGLALDLLIVETTVDKRPGSAEIRPNLSRTGQRSGLRLQRHVGVGAGHKLMTLISRRPSLIAHERTPMRGIEQ